MTVQELLNAAQKLRLSDQIRLASQLMQLVVQKLQSPTESSPPEPSEDPLIGLFSGSSDLATQSEEILSKEISFTSGFTWKKS